MTKTKKRALAAVGSVLLAAACLAFGAFAVRHIQPYMSWLGFRRVRHDAPQEAVHALYTQKHPYIGRMPSDLLALLSRPNDLYRYGQGQETVHLPYGLRQWYGSDFATWEQYRGDPAKQRIFQKNALIIMALIDNCDFVEYGLKWDDKEIDYNAYPQGTHFFQMGRDGFTLDYTKEWADAAIGGDIKKQAGTEEEFRAFLAGIDALELPPVEPVPIQT